MNQATSTPFDENQVVRKLCLVVVGEFFPLGALSVREIAALVPSMTVEQAKTALEKAVEVVHEATGAPRSITKAALGHRCPELARLALGLTS